MIKKIELELAAKYIENKRKKGITDYEIRTQLKKETFLSLVFSSIKWGILYFLFLEIIMIGIPLITYLYSKHDNLTIIICIVSLGLSMTFVFDTVGKIVKYINELL